MKVTNLKDLKKVKQEVEVLDEKMRKASVERAKYAEMSTRIAKGADKELRQKLNNLEAIELIDPSAARRKEIALVKAELEVFGESPAELSRKLKNFSDLYKDLERERAAKRYEYKELAATAFGHVGDPPVCAKELLSYVAKKLYPQYKRGGMSSDVNYLMLYALFEFEPDKQKHPMKEVDGLWKQMDAQLEEALG